MYGWRDGCGGTDWGAVAVSSVFWILVVAAIVVGVVLVTRSLSQRPAAPTAAGSAARAILQERFARGEIDDEEYQRRLRTLG